MERSIALVFTLFVLLNEILLGLNVNVGAGMYLVLMSVALFLLSRRESLDDTSKMIVIFLAIPLFRIAGLFLDISYLWKLALSSGILLFLGIYYLRNFDIDIGDTSKHLWMIFPVVCVGALFGILGNVVFGSGGDLALIMVIVLIAFSEEIFFRGLMQNSIEKSCGFIYSLLIPALIYSALSLHLGIGLMIFFFFVGLFSGLLYSSTKNLFLSIAFNLVVSILIFIIPNLI